MIDKLQAGGPIPLDEEDLTNVSKGMESIASKKVSGSNITEVTRQLKKVLTQISEIYRDELTCESIFFQLLAPEHLLFCDYQQIKNEFDAFSQVHQLWVVEGVVLDNKKANDEIAISIFYFQGTIELTNSNE